jgi:hypothetical protein
MLNIEADKGKKIAASLLGFELARTHHIHRALVLDGAAVRDLIGMTPSTRHLTDEAKAELAGSDGAETMMVFEVLEFTRLDQ